MFSERASVNILSLLMPNRTKHQSKAQHSGQSVKSKHRQSKPAGSVRIVAGQWRGRKIPVLHADGLRPTGDRVRETVFNWLQTDVPGSRCLDLFAGSGALGLEAASRGAASVTLVESSSEVAVQLKKNLVDLQAGQRVQLHNVSANAFLALNPEPFDLVFVDPPFDLQLHLSTVEQLVPDFLAPDGLIYLELPTEELSLIQELSARLDVVKEKHFGDVTVFLLHLNG